MNVRLLFTVIFLVAVSIISCTREKDTLLSPSASNLEIGTGNNKRGVIGKDFHLNADVLAGSKIELVKVVISQKSTETYTSKWSYQIEWDIYKGAKNTNVHKHFDIPADAVKGLYDFTFIVKDQNGTQLQIREDFTILAEADLAIHPVFTTRNVPADNQVFKKGESITARFTVEDVRDTGTLCAILVKAGSNHFPETVSAIDDSKTIVIGKYTGTAAPSWGMYNSITVGAEKDYNTPVPLTISGDKAWESGPYYFIMLYQNTTHNISIYKRIPITIEYE